MLDVANCRRLELVDWPSPGIGRLFEENALGCQCS